MTKGILIDLFDHSGHAAAPYLRKGWTVLQVDIKNGIDILEWDYVDAIMEAVSDIRRIYRRTEISFGILAAIPCTDYALSGAKHFARKDADGSTAKSDLLVDKTKEIIDYVNSRFKLDLWRVENPRSRIHKLHPWLGKITHRFNPCDYAEYTEPCVQDRVTIELLRGTDMLTASKPDLRTVTEIGAYNKDTWLWGNFNIPDKMPIAPVWKENPGWRLYGGNSERTKELRSVDPIGFCKAFYQFNH